MDPAFHKIICSSSNPSGLREVLECKLGTPSRLTSVRSLPQAQTRHQLKQDTVSLERARIWDIPSTSGNPVCSDQRSSDPWLPGKQGWAGADPSPHSLFSSPVLSGAKTWPLSGSP